MDTTVKAVDAAGGRVTEDPNTAAIWGLFVNPGELLTGVVLDTIVVEVAIGIGTTGVDEDIVIVEVVPTGVFITVSQDAPLWSPVTSGLAVSSRELGGARSRACSAALANSSSPVPDPVACDLREEVVVLLYTDTSPSPLIRMESASDTSSSLTKFSVWFLMKVMQSSVLVSMAARRKFKWSGLY